MSVKLHDSFLKAKIAFEPGQPQTVRMYVCGVTVYDSCHLGHGRAYVAFDVVRRYLEFLGYRVKMVRNVTDVDDKIIRRALQKTPAPRTNEEVSAACREITGTYYKNFLDMMALLNVRPADVEPKATEHIPEIIALIRTLIDRSHAYVARDGVYFRVNSFPGYGRLSGKNTDDLIAGARVDVNEDKESPLDFALWKFKKENEPFWPSPWGDGRPGWHIECSAMALKHLGPEIDLHCGGEDLVFPHHENEIAQSEAATGKRFVRYWLHNGFIKINDEKMSKSLGNFLTLEGVFKLYPPKVVRFFFLSKHYRSPIEFSPAGIEESAQAVRRVEQCLQSLEARLGALPEPPKSYVPQLSDNPFFAGFRAMMSDDFNTAGALGVVFELVTAVNKNLAHGLEPEKLSEQASLLILMLDVLGLERKNALVGRETSVQTSDSPASVGAQEVETRLGDLSDENLHWLVRARLELRRLKNFALADRIRLELQKSGVQIKDTKEGSTWTRS